MSFIGRSRVDQLHCDPHLVAGLAHRSLQDMGDIQVVRNVGDLRVLAFVEKRRGARDHPQLRNLR
jgi:hypothetical protein